MLPLGGRITARNVVITTSDYTLSILRLNLTWRYWMFQMTRMSLYYTDMQHNSPEEEVTLTAEENKKLSTNIQLLMDGVEVFMYNRTPSYDNIMEALKRTDSPEKDALLRFSTSLGESGPSPLSTQLTSNANVHNSKANSPYHFPLNLLPINIRIKRGAFVVGNATTPSILVSSFKTGNAILDISKTPCALDYFRTIFDITMEKFQVSLKSNIAYDPDRYTEENTSGQKKASTPRNERLRQIRSLLDKVLPGRKPSTPENPFQPLDWRGLRRYIDDFEDENVMEIRDIEEYAKYSLILDTASTQLKYFYDVPGVYPAQLDNVTYPPPIFGVDLIFSMATIHYGSWADRQRGPIQTMLFPPLSRDSVPSTVCTDPGTKRNYSGFNLRLFTNDEIIFRIPTRELSKDKETLVGGAKNQKITRPFGWIELKVRENSKIASFTSYLASETGWPNTLSVHMDRPEIRTSVNHDLMFTADEHDLECEIGFPLQWNGKCIWKFFNKTKAGKFYFLREHIFLMTDLVSDFASGTPTPYEYQRPFEYQFNWDIKEYRLFFNVNDHNIINDPLDFHNNNYLLFKGDVLEVRLVIPLNGSFSKSTKVDFKVSTNSLDLFLVVPPWHTVSAFMDGNKKMGSSKAFEISGYYEYYNSIEIDKNSFAVINAIGDDITLTFYGYFIKYLFIFRENYFGDFKHFRTFEEYSGGIISPESDASSSGSLGEDYSTDPDYWNTLKTENDLNVLFTFLARTGLIILPCQIYNHNHHIGLLFDNLDVDIHLCHYYMDLQADFSTANGYYFQPQDFEDSSIIFDVSKYKSLTRLRKPEFVLDSFTVHTHRMFGLEPDLLTYHCKWDFASGRISIEGDPKCLTGLKAVLSDFMLGFKDFENTLVYTIPIVYDMANFTFRCPEIILKLATGIPHTYLVAELEDLLVGFNDIANERYSSKIAVSIPSLIVKVVNVENELSYEASLKTSLNFTNICQKAKMLEHRRIQQLYVRQSDAPTHRIPYHIFSENRSDVYMDAFGSLFPSVSLPKGSFPLTKEYEAIRKDDESSIDMDNETSLFESEGDSPINPTTNYYDDDFRPQTPGTPGYKNDTFILEFDTIDAFITPESLASLGSLIAKFQNLDLQFLIDQLHVQTLKKLKMLIMPISMVDNFRFVCPSINFKIVEKSLHSPDLVFCNSPQVLAIAVTILEPSVVYSKTTTRVRQGYNLVESGPMSYALHVREAHLSVHDPNYFDSCLTVSFDDIESWGSKPDTLTTSTSIKKMRMKIESSRTDWGLSFLSLIQKSFRSSFESMKRATESSSMWRREFIHMLTIAAKNSNMQHDPGVITKPAPMLRFCDDHVRSYDSWKVITKLRSILNNLDDYSIQRDRFLRREWESPEDSLEEVTRLFSTWRPWEGDMDQRSQYFRNIFGVIDEVECSGLQALFRLVYFELELGKAGTESDTLSLHGITASLSHGLPSAIDSLFNTSDYSILNLILSMEAFDGSVSTTTLDFVKAIQRFDAKMEDSAPQKVLNPSNHQPLEELKQILEILFHLKLFHLRFDLPNTFCEFYTYENVSSCQMITAERSTKLSSVAVQSKEYSLSLGQNDQEFVTVTLSGLRLAFSEIKNDVGMKMLNIQLNEAEFKTLDKNGGFMPLLDKFVNKDLRILYSLVPDSQPKGHDEMGPFKLPNVNVAINVGKTSAVIELLQPLRIQNSTTQCQIMFANDCGDILFRYSHKSVSFEVSLMDSSILHYEHSKMAVATKMHLSDTLSMASGDIDLGYLKIENSLLISSLELALKHKADLKSRVESLQSIMKALPSKGEGKQTVTKPGTSIDGLLKDIGLKLHVSLEYFGLTTYKDRCRYMFELDGITWVTANIDKHSLGQITPFWGELTVPATRFTVFDPLFSIGLSKLVDVNFSVKILNDNLAEQVGPAQSLQVESQYFRVCFSPPVLIKLLELADGLTRLLRKYESPVIESTHGSGDTNTSDLLQDVSSSDGAASGWSKIHFTSVHVLSYNFCVGWLFGSSKKDYPGFILGAERFFAVTKADLGKLSLMEGYLSVANGSTTSSFYSMLSEVDSLNRAYMAQMQLNYCVSDTNTLCIDLLGDELDVRFMSNSVSILERAVQSGSEIQSYLEERSKQLVREKQGRAKFERHVPEPTPLSLNTASFLIPKFNSIQMTLTFAGSKVFIYRLQEDNLDHPPSLSVHSPAVLIAVFYQHQKNEVRKHHVKVEILMSPSDNTLYSSCVPVVMDFIDASKLMFRTSKPFLEQPSKPESPAATSPEGPDTGENIGNILKQVNFHFGFKIEKQRVSLSCEPTAKVAAIVEYDGGSFHACTSLADSNSLYILTQLSSISASLQHIYSDERSGSLYIKGIMLSTSLSFLPTIDVVTSVSISDVTAYVRMKQYQDLDLFKDIWYPKKYQMAHLESQESTEVKQMPLKRSYSKFREVSTTYAIPVSLTFILSNISVEVDFGAALGTVFLDLDRAWAFSRKTSNWFYELQFGLQTLVLGFDGRLGGYLKVERLFLNSGIEWKIDELPYLEIPLVVFTAGFKHVHLKTAFDNHVFAFANLEGWRMDAFNRKNGLNISKDHLYVIAKYDTVEVFLTSLAASDFYDIFSTISRLVEEKRTSYKEILKDSNKEHMFREKTDPSKLIEVAKKLETKIEVSTGVTTVQIYPQSLDDSRVLVISLDKSQANFLQNEYLLGITDEVELQLNNLNASLATTAGIEAHHIDEYDVPQFVEYARKCKGGNILSFPKFMISMRTYQKYNSYIVEHLFQSSFGGTVDVRWNLGSVSLVRDMYAAHKRAFSSRIEYQRTETRSIKDQYEIRDTVFKADTFKDDGSKNMFEDSVDPSEDIVHDLNETLDKVSKGSKFQYVALAPPVIEAPQLKELGNATPPLEWFGLHRNKFPDATHQFVIVTLQKLIHEIEQNYSKALGDD